MLVWFVKLIQIIQEPCVYYFFSPLKIKRKIFLRQLSLGTSLILKRTFYQVLE